MKESYGVAPQFHAQSLEILAGANTVLALNNEQGFKITIRQLYYQLVANGTVENTLRSYENFVALMTKGRMAGKVDWDALADGTREVIARPHWGSGEAALQHAADRYMEDLWDEQPNRVIVIAEKEALISTLQGVCQEWLCPLQLARGYSSATSLRELVKQRILCASQRIVVLHLGDHDASGIDMSRDLEERLQLFAGSGVHIDFRRIALSMEQVEAQAVPPNPVKVTENRYNAYRKRFGDESWELEALRPQYLRTLVEQELEQLIDFGTWNHKCKQVEKVRGRLQALADNFDTEYE